MPTLDHYEYVQCLDTTNYGDGDRLWEIECWGDRLDIMNYGSGDQLCEDRVLRRSARYCDLWWWRSPLWR
ncbi:hypothetical protein VB774_23355 [Pseudanabaena galeata UHCC 0370]|uniref:Uncharacterized protein n=1 Tax=Pseudanabaena galeata UHCC 0370 TaxID=3110310 RepID=A0ABU5TQN7_9CYAN|nr:hypothetical protein [Pseudanabaena galeata]MEA5480584.1 hypothetical protein [Pseudanabaena galeata UHCC 0370]